MSVISIITAAGTNSVIGQNNELPWSKRLTPDMRYFAATTAGHPVLMGWNTWESIPPKFRPLDRLRTTIILSRTRPYLELPMTFVARSFEEALEIAGVSIGSEEVFVAGGAQVYETALRYADRIYKTEVHEAPDGDTFFPPHPEITREVSRSSYADVDPAYRPKLDFVIYER